MNSPIFYIDRKSGQKKEEKIYFESVLRFLYGSKLGRILAMLLARFSFFSALYGFFQNRPSSKRIIGPFVKRYEIDLSEIEKPLEEYRCFNDFFTRKLKSASRPLVGTVITPADGRYLCYQNSEALSGFVVKGQKFSVSELIQDAALAKKYEKGSMAIARLCPTDYHRFHFPCDCIPGPHKLINGPLYSVNPIAIKKNFSLLSKNKRVLTELKTDRYGKLLYIEIGATSVGSIRQTYTPGKHYKKGEEKGFFSFGGSCIILLFEPGLFQFDSDLLENTSKGIETLCLLGQSLGS